LSLSQNPVLDLKTEEEIMEMIPQVETLLFEGI
jgi:hypothetical protein